MISWRLFGRVVWSTVVVGFASWRWDLIGEDLERGVKVMEEEENVVAVEKRIDCIFSVLVMMDLCRLILRICGWKRRRGEDEFDDMLFWQLAAVGKEETRRLFICSGLFSIIEK